MDHRPSLSPPLVSAGSPRPVSRPSSFVRSAMPRIEQFAFALEADPVDAQLTQNYELVEHLVSHRLAQRKKPSLETLRGDRIKWKAVCDYFLSQRIDIRTASAHELRMFLATKADNGVRNRASYLRLIEQVLVQSRRALPAHDAVITAQEAARAVLDSDDYRYADARQNNRLPRTLTEPELQRLEQWLRFNPSVGDWKVARNWAYMACVFGSGAPIQVIRLLRVDEVVVDSTSGRLSHLDVRGTHRHPPHHHQLNEIGKQGLAWWMKYRKALPIERGLDPLRNETAEFVFPATREGAPLERDAAALACSKSFEQLGIDTRGAPTQILRTEFAKRQLAHGVELPKIADYMGVFDLRSLQPYVAATAGAKRSTPLVQR